MSTKPIDSFPGLLDGGDGRIGASSSGMAGKHISPGRPAGLSAYWRKNTSVVESVELALLLRALRKVIGHLGPAGGTVAYTGMSGFSDSVIQIDPETVMGQYPVPSASVDQVVGQVIQAALMRIVWSAHVRKILASDIIQMPPVQQVGFQKIVAAGEEIYVHRHADRKVFGRYTAVHGKTRLAAMEAEIPGLPPSLEELIYIWRARQYRTPVSRKVKWQYEVPLYQLGLLAAALEQVAETPERVAVKCAQRAELYLKCWQRMEKSVRSLRIIKKQLQWWVTDKGRTLDKRSCRVRKPAGKAAPVSLMQAIETHLAADAVDITPLIRSVAGYDNETVVPMSRWDFHRPAHPVIDKHMISRLRMLFLQYANRKTIVSRGLLAGRIDRRRLYRAPLNGRCFMAVERVPASDWAVGLLIDASGSMRGAKWKIVESIVANLHKALSGTGNRICAWAYFEVSGISMISGLLDGNTVCSIPPSGQTASGQAIIAAGILLPKRKTRRILIHITDGACNFGCDVAYGRHYCRCHEIQLVTIGCGCKNKQKMTTQYGRGIQFVDDFEQLPQALERLLKWSFLYPERPAAAMKTVGGSPLLQYCNTNERQRMSI